MLIEGSENVEQELDPLAFVPGSGIQTGEFADAIATTRIRSSWLAGRDVGR